MEHQNWVVGMLKAYSNFLPELNHSLLVVFGFLLCLFESHVYSCGVNFQELRTNRDPTVNASGEVGRVLQTEIRGLTQHDRCLKGGSFDVESETES